MNQQGKADLSHFPERELLRNNFRNGHFPSLTFSESAVPAEARQACLLICCLLLFLKL